MVIGTYRPVDVILAGHPIKSVKRELQAHRLCHELPLEYLTEEDVTQYLAERFPGQNLPSRLRRTIYRRTEGNPLFMVNLVQYLIDQKVIVARARTAWSFCVECSEVENGDSLHHKRANRKASRAVERGRACRAGSGQRSTGMEFSTVADRRRP